MLLQNEQSFTPSGTNDIKDNLLSCGMTIYVLATITVETLRHG
jgi:hypothetical protein